MKNEPPKTHKENGRKYYYIKSYKNVYLYEDEYGMKECFKADQLRLVKKYKVAYVKWNKMELGLDINKERKKKNKPFSW